MPQAYRAIRPMFKTDRWRICRDDFVVILNGPEKGKTGKVLEIFKDKRVPQVIVEGRNMRKKKIQTGPEEFFVVTMEAPLHYSQVQLCDSATGKPFRVVYMYTPDGKKVRARKVANPTVDDILTSPAEQEADPRAGLVGKKDTLASLARVGTYRPAEGFPFRPRNLERLWAEMAPDAPADGSDEVASSSGAGGNIGGGRSALFAAPAGARGYSSWAEAEGAAAAVGCSGAAVAAPGAVAGSFALLGLRQGSGLAQVAAAEPAGAVAGVRAWWELGFGRRRGGPGLGPMA